MGQRIKAEDTFSDYYSSLSFREGPYAPHKGVHRLTPRQAKKRNHYRFDYDEQGRIKRISFALGDKLRKPNHTANYFWYASVEEYQYKNKIQIVTYRDEHNQKTKVKGAVANSYYTLDEHGRRIALTYRDNNNNPIENNWQISSYQWQHQSDGSIIETRRNLVGKKVNLRPSFDFKDIRLSYDVNGFTSLMQYVDDKGKNIGMASGFAQDRFTMSQFGELVRYDVLSVKNQHVANMQGIATGLLTFTDFGYESISSYLNAEGSATRTNYGWWRSQRQYDQFGNLTVNSFEDLNGNLKNNPNTGYASARLKWHKDGLRRQWLKYFDENGKPVSHKTRGYHGVLYQYDEQQRLRQMSLIDKDDQRTQHRIKGWAIKRFFTVTRIILWKKKLTL